MTPAARLEMTMHALSDITAAPMPADVVMARFFRARRFVGSKDRAHIAAALYRILRSKARLDWWLQHVGLTQTPRTLALADQMLSEGVPLAALHNLCTGDQYAPDLIDSAEHEGLRQLSNQKLTHGDMPLFTQLECPPVLAEKLQAAFGDRFAAVMQAMQEPAPMDIRVNTLQADTDRILKELKQAGFDVARCRYATDGLRLFGRPNLNNHNAFREGLVEVQDEGSQLIALLTDAQAGMRVLDFCAGAGGKTLALAAAMQNKGRIVATDIGQNRLTRAKLRFRRADVQNCEIHLIKDEHDPWLKRHKNEFDRVLVDAPCTGTGTWRRNPEMRWRQNKMDLDELTNLQERILSSAARMVKAGGRLVYATCSLLPAENEAQIDKFLSHNSDFSLLPLAAIWPKLTGVGPQPEGNDSMLRLDPAQHKTDGFFAAVLERKAT